MKLFILGFSLLHSTAFLLSAQSNIPQPTHLVVQIAPAPGVPLGKTEEVFYYYDNNGNCFESKTNAWDDTTWVLHARGYYTLNLAGKPTEILERRWDLTTSTLVDNRRTTIGYHTDGQENYRKSELWNSSANMWETGIIQASTFDSTGQLVEFTFSTYAAGMQINGDRSINFYESAGRISAQVKQGWQNGLWQNTGKIEYVYDDSDNEFDTAYARSWNELDSIWAEVSTRSFQTLTSLQRVVLSESLENGDWVPSTLITTNYDANQQVLEQYSENWNTVDMVWVIQNKYEYAYNADQSLLQFKYAYRDNNTGGLHLFIVVDYDYDFYPVSTQLADIQSEVTISPNPAADFVQVYVEGNGISNITLIDLHGKVLARTTTAAKLANLSLAGLPAGTYFLQVKQESGVKVLPIVKN